MLTAIGNGIHVVEAGGNGYQDLDAPVYSTGNYGHWPFLSQNNSGAIIVGAGAVPQGAFPGGFYGSDVARSRLLFSNYGSRLNLQGWGEMVVTTGYGGYYNALGANLYYDSSFAGTSSASPIVAAAVALVESRYEALNSQPLPPLSMRSILMSTGSAQQNGTYPTSQNIGSLPDVQSALGYNFNSLLFAGGTYPVGNSYTFKKLTQVADTLNQKILTGNVIFELQSDYDGTIGETFPIVFYEYQTQGGSWTVTIRPASGVSTRTTAGSTIGLYPLIDLNGADRITLDGRSGGSGSSISWMIRNTSTSNVGPTVRLSNDATYNVLEYLQVEGQNSSTLSGTIYFGELSYSKGNSFNLISNCDVRDRSDGLGAHAVGIYSDWATGAANDSNTIQNCNMYNWTSYGMKLYGQRWNILSNSLYETAIQNTQLTGIMLLQHHTQQGGGHTVSNNFIGGTSPSAVGGPLTNTSGTLFTGIQMTCDMLLPNSVQGNIIRNISYTDISTPSFVGINLLALAPGVIGTLSGNTIGDTSASKKITIDGKGSVKGIVLNSFIATATQNVIVNIEQPNPNPGEFRGIELTATPPNSPKYKILRNTIRSVGPNQFTAFGNVYGIYIDVAFDSIMIANNMITLGVGLTNNCQYRGICDNGQIGSLPINVQAHFNSISAVLHLVQIAHIVISEILFQRLTYAIIFSAMHGPVELVIILLLQVQVHQCF